MVLAFHRYVSIASWTFHSDAIWYMSRLKNQKRPRPQPAFVGCPPRRPKRPVRDLRGQPPEDLDAITAKYLEEVLKETRKKRKRK
jgi:hypothetical protein